MKRLSELVERVSLRDLVEALTSTISDTEVQPEPEAEGEEEFVKVHKTEKHAEPYGNKKASDATKKDTSTASKEPKKGFPSEVKEDLDKNSTWFIDDHGRPRRIEEGDAYSRAEEKSKHVWHKDEDMSLPKKKKVKLTGADKRAEEKSKHVWHKDEKMTREETELDEAEQLQLPSDSKKSWKWKKTEPSKKTRGKYKHPDSTMQNPWMWKVKEKLSVENEETEQLDEGPLKDIGQYVARKALGPKVPYSSKRGVDRYDKVGKKTYHITGFKSTNRAREEGQEEWEKKATPFNKWRAKKFGVNYVQQKEEAEQIDESGAIGKHKQTMIKRPKFDARGNVILTKTAKDNITYGKKSRKLSGKEYSSDKKRFGEETEQLDELSKYTLKSYVKKAAKDIGKRSYHAGVSSDLEGGMKDLEKAEKHEKYIPKAVHRIAGRYYPKHVKTRNPTFGGHRQYKGAWSEKELTDPKTGERYPRKKGRTGPYRANEEVEQLDELKKETLGSYISKAVPSKKSAEEGLKTRTKHGLGPGALSKIAKKRDTGIDRAAQRLGGTYEVGKPVKVMIPGRDDNDPGSGPYTMKRKKLYHAEETEQLDELSKKTLGRVDYAARKKSKDLEKQAMDVWEKRPKAEKTRDKIYDKADKVRDTGQKARDRIHKRGAFKFYKTDERKNKEILDRLNWEETEQLDEKAVSKAQQRLFGIALATRRGETDRGGKEATRLAADLPAKELRKFAKTKHKGLPERKESK